MIFLVQKVIRGAICDAIHRYARAIKKSMKDYDKSKKVSCLKYQDVNDLYCWRFSQKLFVNNFKWIEDISQFIEYIRKTYETGKLYFLEVYVQYPEKVHNYHYNNENRKRQKGC